jgi:hypothetical protein
VIAFTADFKVGRMGLTHATNGKAERAVFQFGIKDAADNVPLC